MRICRNLLAFALMALPMLAFAQPRNCGAMEHLGHLHAQNPGLQAEMDRIEQETQRFLADYDHSASRNVITIPVVFHIVYRTSAENISTARILDQLQVLNDDFRRTNADADNTWSQAADTNIEFCLATVDPNGNPTDGINRVQTGKRSFRTNDDIKKSSKGGVDAWNTSDYMNIWVGTLSNSILGYAQFPGGPAATDGIVLLNGSVGGPNSPGTASPYHLGRTATHEVGHYLNLRHIWGDGGCSVDDFCADTPESDASNGGCAEGHVSCGTVDMVQNYMDYSYDACMNLFTADQAARMTACLNGIRSSLLSSGACGGGGPTGPTCSDGVMNGDETGVDCGGPTCPACPDPGACDDPTNLYSQARKRGREANLSWDAVAAAQSYNVRLRQVGASSWNTASTTGTSITATGLTNGNSYEWGVQSVCAGGVTSNWASSTFTAGQSGREMGEFADVLLFPNPAQDYLNVEISLAGSADAGIVLSDNITDEVLHISVVDMLGRTLQVHTADGSDISMELDTREFGNGMYFLLIETEAGDRQIERFIISK